MLKAATTVYQSGRKAIGQHKDPYADGPFECCGTDDGFVLVSKLIVNGAPVTMRFKTSEPVR